MNGVPLRQADSAVAAQDGRSILSEAVAPASEMKPGRDRVLDIAKGIAILLVVFGHLTPLGFLPGQVSGLTSQMSSLIINAPYRWFLKAAVPAFYLVSSMIYLSRRTGNRAFLWRRLRRTSSLLGVWMLAQYACLAIVSGRLPAFTLSDLRVGGPTPFGLPIYYFFVDLLLLNFVMEGVCLLRAKAGDAITTSVSAITVGGFTLLFFALPLMRITAIDYWSLWPFLCYPFMAVLIGGPRPPGWVGSTGVALFLLGTAGEIVWRLAGVDMNALGYARVPALAGSMIVLVAARAIDVRAQGTSVVLSKLGRLSLGLFVVHPFSMLLLSDRMPYRTFDWAGGELTFRVEYAIVGFALTLGTVVLLSRSPLRMLVTSASTRGAADSSWRSG